MSLIKNSFINPLSAECLKSNILVGNLDQSNNCLLKEANKIVPDKTAPREAV